LYYPGDKTKQRRWITVKGWRGGKKERFKKWREGTGGKSKKSNKIPIETQRKEREGQKISQGRGKKLRRKTGQKFKGGERDISRQSGDGIRSRERGSPGKKWAKEGGKK